MRDPGAKEAHLETATRNTTAPVLQSVGEAQAALKWSDIMSIGSWQAVARTYEGQYKLEGGKIPGPTGAGNIEGQADRRSQGTHPMRSIIEMHRILVYREEEAYGEAHLRRAATGPRITFG